MQKPLVRALTFSLLACSFVLAAYSDVPEEHWAKPYIDQVDEMGIIKGFADNTFRGREFVKRYDAAQFFVKFNEYLDHKFDLLYASLGESKSQKLSEKLEDELAIVQELEDELWDLKADVSFLKRKASALSGYKEPLKAQFRSRAVFNINGSDRLQQQALLHFDLDYYKLDGSVQLILDTITPNTDELFGVLDLTVRPVLPGFGSTEIRFQRGPGARINPLNELHVYAPNAVWLTNEKFPLGFGLREINASRNALLMYYDLALAAGLYRLEFNWVKKYTYQNSLVRVFENQNLILARDYYRFFMDLNHWSLETWLSPYFGVRDFYSWILRFNDLGGRSMLFRSAYLSPQALDWTCDDQYVRLGAVDILRQKIPNGSRYMAIEVSPVWSIFSLAAGVISPLDATLSSTWQYSFYGESKVSDAMKVIGEIRWINQRSAADVQAIGGVEVSL